MAMESTVMDGNGRCDGDLTAIDGLMVMDGDGRRLISDGRCGKTAINGMMAPLRQVTARWQLNGNGRQGTAQAQWQ